MRKFRMHFTLALFASFVTLSAIAQEIPPVPKPMWVDKVWENLFVIRGPAVLRPTMPDNLLHEPGDVAVLVTPDGVILVDDKYAENAADVMNMVKSISPLPIRYVFNTHHHTDHAGGDAFFLDHGAVIIAHRNVRENMIRNNLPGAPRVVFDDRISVFLGGIEVQARYLGRGHTDGDSVVYFPALKVLHTGDLVIDGMPHIDYDNGASAIEWVKAIDKLLQIDFDIAIPGHGRLLSKEDIRQNRAAFEKMNRHMYELVNTGMSKAEATADLKLYLKEIGWDHTVSTLRFLEHSLSSYYDEIAANVQKTKRLR